jgi:tetratricopeptide (TPR) repeat protein
VRRRASPTFLLLGVLAAAHAVASLLLAPAWHFAKYPNLVAGLVAGQLTSSELGDASPGYLLATLVLGPSPMRWLQALAGGLAVVLVQRMGARLGGAVAGWGAAVALAAAQPWLVSGAVLEPDLLIGVLSTCAVAAVLLGDPARRRGPILAGLAVGLAASLRPTSLLLAAVLLGWLLLRPEPSPAWRDRWRSAGSAGLALLLTAVLPGLLLHARAGQEWRTTMSAGQVFHQGHRPESSGLGATFPVLLKLAEALEPDGPGHRPDHAHELYRRFAAAEAGRPLTAPEAELAWAGRSLALARLEPRAFAEGLGRTLVFLVAASGLDTDVPEAVALLQRSEGRSLPLGWLSLAGLAGVLLTLRRSGATRLVIGWVGSGAVAALLFYHQSRYALAILPAWCLLAGLATAALAEAWGSPRRLGWRVVLALAPLLLLAPGFVRQQRRLETRQLLVPVRSHVEALKGAGLWVEARAAFVEEQAAFPDRVLPFARRGYGLDADGADLALDAAERARARFGTERPVDRYLLAVLYAGAGRCDLALPLASSAAEAGFHAAVADSSLDPDLLASDCLLASGRPGPALDAIRRSLRGHPGTLDGLARAVAAGATGSPPELPRWEAELGALHDAASVRYALARQRRRWGDPGRALDDADWLVARLPEVAPVAEFERALALLDLGRETEALQAYARSLPVRLYLFGTDRLDGPFRALVAARPESRVVAQVALSHWLRRGDRDEVRRLLAAWPGLGGPEPRR